MSRKTSFGSGEMSMLAAYSGNSAYCYSNSLRMCLQHAGLLHLPEVGLLECLTGMPFGACFLQLDAPQFLPSPADINPDNGLTRALDILGWTCARWQGDDVDSALAALKEALSAGLVLLGPLDMGFLPYDPNHRIKRGGDHFIAVLSLDANRVRVHDPQLYPFAVLPVTDLVRAWNAQDLGYSTCAYTLREDFREQKLRFLPLLGFTTAAVPRLGLGPNSRTWLDAGFSTDC